MTKGLALLYLLELQGCQGLAHACNVSMLGHELCPVALDVLFLCDQYIDRRDCHVTYSMLTDVTACHVRTVAACNDSVQFMLGTSTAVSGAKRQRKP